MEELKIDEIVIEETSIEECILDDVKDTTTIGEPLGIKQENQFDRTGKELSLFERMGIEYRMEDGYAYPVIKCLEKCKKPIGNLGKYGMLWLFYTKEYDKQRYTTLVRFGLLEATALRVNENAFELLESIISDHLRRHPMKNPNSFVERWRLLEDAKSIAEEIVLKDIVYRFH